MVSAGPGGGGSLGNGEREQGLGAPSPSGVSLSPWGGSLCLQVPELEKPTVRILRPERVLGIIRAIKEQGSSKLQVPGPSTVLSSPPPHHTP